MKPASPALSRRSSCCDSLLVALRFTIVTPRHGKTCQSSMLSRGCACSARPAHVAPLMRHRAQYQLSPARACTSRCSGATGAREHSIARRALQSLMITLASSKRKLVVPTRCPQVDILGRLLAFLRAPACYVAANNGDCASLHCSFCAPMRVARPQRTHGPCVLRLGTCARNVRQPMRTFAQVPASGAARAARRMQPVQVAKPFLEGPVALFAGPWTMWA